MYDLEDEPISKDPLDLKRKAIELVGSHLKNKECSRIMRYHTQLSISLGKPIGILEREGKESTLIFVI